MQQKIKDIINKISDSINLKFKPILSKIDLKASELIPNPKVKKISYIAFGSLFGFMFLIIIIGILTAPFRNSNLNKKIESVKKPVVITQSPEPQKELSENQNEILKFKNSIKDLNFPESLLNIPFVEREITI